LIQTGKTCEAVRVGEINIIFMQNDKEDLVTRKILDTIRNPKEEEQLILNGNFIVTYTFSDEEDSTINDFKNFLESKELVYAKDQSTYFGGNGDKDSFEQILTDACSKFSGKSKVYLYHIDHLNQDIRRIKIL